MKTRAGEFDELFLKPLVDLLERHEVAIRVLRGFDTQLVADLAGLRYHEKP